MTTRVAAVDCGTNSLRLLVVEDTGRHIRQVHRRLEVVRLGQAVDASGRIAAEALERAFTVCRQYAQTCRELDVQRVRFVATSAARDAANGEDLLVGVRECFSGMDTRADILDGDTEANLTFQGATSDLRVQGVPGPFLVADIGGGSTELVVGDASVQAMRSLDVGSVRFTERYVAGAADRTAGLAQAHDHITAALDDAFTQVDASSVRSLVGVAGTVTTVTAHVLRLQTYDSGRVHGARMPVESVINGCQELARMDPQEAARLPYMQPGREDVIGVGALIWAGVVEAAARRAGLNEVCVSESDILDAAAASLVV